MECRAPLDVSGGRVSYLARLALLVTGGTDADSFDIVPASGQIQTRLGVTYNHEANYSYSLIVSVSDGKHADGEADPAVYDSIAVTVDIADVNEAPELSGPVTRQYEENLGEVVASYEATDPEDDPVDWSLSGRDGGFFSIDGGGVEFLSPPDREARDPVYQVTVRAEDDEGLSGTRSLTVTVTDVNEPPVLEGPASVPYDEDRRDSVATYTALDPEKRPVTWSLLGADRGSFTLTDGVLAFSTAPNHEDQIAYSVTVRASDGPNPVTQPATVTVGNVEEPGDLTLSSRQPLIGTLLSATLTDPDGSISGQSWTWERSPNGSNWTEITGATSGSYRPTDDDLNQDLRVTVEYGDGHGSGKSRQATSANRVQAPRPDNRPPAFANPSVDRAVPENSTAGTAVGAPVQADDPDLSDRLLLL